MAGYPLDSAVMEYILFCRIEGKSPNTIRWYRQKLDYFEHFLRERELSTRLDEIGRSEIRAFIDHLQSEVKAGSNNPYRPATGEPLSMHTIHGYVRTLRAFFSWVVREGLLEDSPMQGVKNPKVPKLLMPSFSEDQVRRLLSSVDRRNTIGARNYTILVTLLDTGLRASELTNLREGDLFLKEGYFKVSGKGGKERIVPIGSTCRATLTRYVHRHRPEPATPRVDNLFLTRDGHPLKPDYLYKIVSEACNKADVRNVRPGPHTCRHTFARRFLMNGGDLLTLQRILGHSSLEVVRLYVNLNTNDLLQQQCKYSPIDNLYHS
jgi:site-specific recombinase XerD